MSSSLSQSIELGVASAKSERFPGYDLSGHSVTMCLIVCRSAPQSQLGEVETPHLCSVSAHTPQLDRMRLSRTSTFRGKLKPARGVVGFTIWINPVV